MDLPSQLAADTLRAVWILSCENAAGDRAFAEGKGVMWISIAAHTFTVAFVLFSIFLAYRLHKTMEEGKRWYPDSSLLGVPLGVLLLLFTAIGSYVFLPKTTLEHVEFLKIAVAPALMYGFVVFCWMLGVNSGRDRQNATWDSVVGLLSTYDDERVLKEIDMARALTSARGAQDCRDPLVGLRLDCPGPEREALLMLREALLRRQRGRRLVWCSTPEQAVAILAGASDLEAAAMPGPKVSGSQWCPAAPKLQKPTKENKRKAVLPFVSKDPARFNMTFMHSDGKNLVGTDGRVMLVVEGDFGGSTKAPVFLDPNTGKIDQNGTDDETVRAVAYRQVLPTRPTPIARKVSTQSLYHPGRLAASMTDERFKSVQFHVNPDKSLGWRVYTPNVGDMDYNLQEGSQFIVNVNPDYLLHVVRAARLLGHEHLDIDTAAHGEEAQVAAHPLLFKAKGFQALVMPIRGDPNIVGLTGEEAKARFVRSPREVIPTEPDDTDAMDAMVAREVAERQDAIEQAEQADQPDEWGLTNRVVTKEEADAAREWLKSRARETRPGLSETRQQCTERRKRVHQLLAQASGGEKPHPLPLTRLKAPSLPSSTSKSPHLLKEEKEEKEENEEKDG